MAEIDEDVSDLEERYDAFVKHQPPPSLIIPKEKPAEDAST
jgi:hypothetical protein